MAELLDLPAVGPESMRIRRASFPDRIRFHAPGLKRYETSEYGGQDAAEFVSISLTGTACSLGCEHCKMAVLRGMDDLSRFDGTLFELCRRLAERGARGVLISGGSDAQGRVPLLPHVPDLVRARRELGLVVRCTRAATPAARESPPCPTPTTRSMRINEPTDRPIGRPIERRSAATRRRTQPGARSPRRSADPKARSRRATGTGNATGAARISEASPRDAALQTRGQTK